MEATQATQGSSSFNFQRIVIMIAIVMLIAAMIFIGYAMMYDQSSTISWPPETPKCPDFWTLGSDGKTCTNTTDMPNDKCEYNGIPGGTQGMPTCPK